MSAERHEGSISNGAQTQTLEEQLPIISIEEQITEKMELTYGQRNRALTRRRNRTISNRLLTRRRLHRH